MGGASTEITFQPAHAENMPRRYRQSVELFGEEYLVYTYSYECYGLNEAYRRYLAYLVQVHWLSRCVMCIRGLTVTKTDFNKNRNKITK